MPFSGIQKPQERIVTHDPATGMELPKYVSYDCSGGKVRNLRYRLRWPMSMIPISQRNGDNSRRRQKSSNFNSLEELLMSDAYAKVLAWDQKRCAKEKRRRGPDQASERRRTAPVHKHRAVRRGLRRTDESKQASMDEYNRLIARGTDIPTGITFLREKRAWSVHRNFCTGWQYRATTYTFKHAKRLLKACERPRSLGDVIGKNSDASAPYWPCCGPVWRVRTQNEPKKPKVSIVADADVASASNVLVPVELMCMVGGFEDREAIGGESGEDDEDESGDESGDESEDESEDEGACEDDSEDVCEVECEAACEDDSEDEYCEVECEADSESGEESNNGSGEAESELKKVTVKMPRRIVATPKEHHHHHHRVHIALSGVSGSLVAAMCSPAGWTRHETLLDASWGDGLVLE